MKRKTIVVDEDGHPMTYLQVANRLGISVQALRNKLYHIRLRDDAEYVSIIKLQAMGRAHNQLLTREGRRISYKAAAAFLDVPVGRLYRVVFILRGLDRRVRAGAAIPMGALERELSMDGEILFDIGVVHQEHEIDLRINT